MITKKPLHHRPTNFYFAIKRAIASAWKVVLSSDGYANYGTGNVLTSDNVGPNGFGNNNAWCVLSQTINNQQYEFCIQTDGYMGLRLKYSKLGFNSGMDNLGASPGATDQQVLVGGGTDIAPTYQQITGGILSFNVNRAFINVTTSTNKINFILKPVIPLVIPLRPQPVNK